MKEIIHLQVGQCGNNIGTKFWEIISEEHGINSTGSYIGNNNKQLERINVYYNESCKGKYVPRAILMDLESSSIDSIRNSTYGSLFESENYICGNIDSCNNWAKGYYTEGSKIINKVMNNIRKESEKCNSLQGFQICHSLGGGTGSGLGTLLLSKLREEYKDKNILTFSIIPSSKESNSDIHSYNTILSFRELVKSVNEVIVLDNEAISNICNSQLNISNPTYNDINNIISMGMSGVTSTLRLPGKINNNLNILYQKLVPKTDLHFFMIGMSPIIDYNSEFNNNLTVSELINQCLDNKNMLCSVNLKHGSCYSASINFRGNISSKEVYENMVKITRKKSPNYIEWIPKKVYPSIRKITPKNYKKNITVLCNSNTVIETFRRVNEEFERTLKNKSHINLYTCEGMDEMEFSESELNMNNLISSYVDYGDGTAAEDGEYEEEESEEADEEDEPVEEY